MENPNGPEKPSPETVFVRPPVLDLTNGLAIFLLVYLVFLVLQMTVMVMHVRSVHPDLAEVSWRALPSTEQWTTLASNGDVWALVYMISGGAALLLLLLLAWIWKRDRLVALFGLKLPAFKPFLAWTGFFICVFVVLEVIAQFLPESKVMDKIIGSITDYPMFFFGSCLVPAVFEEFLVRGLLLGSLRLVVEKNMAIAITAGLFTLMHFYYDWYLLLFAVLPLAVVLGYARTNSGSIWTGVFLHFANNAATVVLPVLLR
jgi:membrane protease YdiL (CAAX protease family)